MLHPINTTIVPHGGLWTVSIEGAGPPITAPTWHEFIKNISKRLQSNGLDKHGWKEWAIDLMCQQRPDIPSEDVGAPQTRGMTGDDVKRFLKTMWELFEQNSETVDFETQNQRVDICEKCPRLGYISCFIGCAQVTEVVNKFMAGRDVPKFPQIHRMACLECGCTASVKTMWPVEVLRKIDSEMQIQPNYPPNCWMVTEPANQSPPGNQGLGPSSAQPPPGAT